MDLMRKTGELSQAGFIYRIKQGLLNFLAVAFPLNFSCKKLLLLSVNSLLAKRRFLINFLKNVWF